MKGNEITLNDKLSHPQMHSQFTVHILYERNTHLDILCKWQTV